MVGHSSKVKLGDVGYPFLLQEIHDPPKALYYKGELPKNDQILLAVVGSRKMTPYGKSVVETLLPHLIYSGVGIVSGLATGIDTAALETALKYKGKAHGVIGGGMDERVFYPKRNIALSREMILSGGALISEYPDTYPPLPQNFAIRNRIIAGMCHGTLIIEASEKSGSLITADVAMNEGRDVFSVPNALFLHNSKGTNNLLKNGAHIVTDAKDILSILGVELKFAPSKNNRENSADILHFLSSRPIHIDELIKRGNLTAHTAGAILSELEIQGAVKNVGGNHYIRLNE